MKYIEGSHFVKDRHGNELMVIGVSMNMLVVIGTGSIPKVVYSRDVIYNGQADCKGIPENEWEQADMQ